MRIKLSVVLLTLVLLGNIGCTRTLEYTTSTEVYPTNPNVIQKINISTTIKTQW